jgi:hypothetical protein
MDAGVSPHPVSIEVRLNIRFGPFCKGKMDLGLIYRQPAELT